MKTDKTFSCTEYRKEMMLLGLQKRLYENDLTEAEKQDLKARIADLKAAIQLD